MPSRAGARGAAVTAGGGGLKVPANGGTVGRAFGATGWKVVAAGVGAKAAVGRGRGASGGVREGPAKVADDGEGVLNSVVVLVGGRLPAGPEKKEAAGDVAATAAGVVAIPARTSRALSSLP